MNRLAAIIASSACGAILAGCAQAPDSGPETDPLQLAEGLWSVSQTIFTVEADGDGAEDAKQMAGRQLGDRYCLFTDDAARGVPALMEKAGWGSCEQDMLTMNPESEQLEGAYTCSGPDGSKSEIAVKGALTPDNVDFSLERSTSQPGGKGKVTMTMSFGASHQGACEQPE